MRFFARLLISALSLGLASYIIPGIYFDSFFTMLIAAFLLSIVNAFVRPIFLLLTLPLTIITFGIFIMFVNGILLALVAWILPGFSIYSLGSAIWGWLIVAITSWFGTRLLDVN